MRIALIVSMFLILSLCASNKLISRIDIDLALESAPSVEYRRASVLPVKVGSESRWLVINIIYTANKESMTEPSLVKKRGDYELRFNGFVDDLGVRVTVLQNTGLQASGKYFYGMYTGETAFYSIRRDGKRHLVQMFVPGKLLDRYSRAANGQITAAAEKDFMVEVVFTVAGKTVAKEYYGGNAKAFAGALQMVPGNMVFKGGVFPRSRTPWALFGFDDFDVEKELPAGKM